jgi:hypothetical protein
MRRCQALAWTHSIEGRSSVSEQAALIGPVERQIEFGKTRRSDLEVILDSRTDHKIGHRTCSLFILTPRTPLIEK